MVHIRELYKYIEHVNVYNCSFIFQVQSDTISVSSLRYLDISYVSISIGMLKKNTVFKQWSPCLDV